MKLEGEGFLLRIYLGEQDKWDHMRRHEAIVLKAREMGWQARPFCADPAPSRDVVHRNADIDELPLGLYSLSARAMGFAKKLPQQIWG